MASILWRSETKQKCKDEDDGLVFLDLYDYVMGTNIWQ